MPDDSYTTMSDYDRVLAYKNKAKINRLKREGKWKNAGEKVYRYKSKRLKKTEGLYKYYNS